MKILYVIITILLFVISFSNCFGFFKGMSDNDLNEIFNAIKSAVHAKEKEFYLKKIQYLNVKNHSNRSLMLDSAIELVALRYADERNFKKALVWCSRIKNPQMRSSLKSCIEQNKSMHRVG